MWTKASELQKGDKVFTLGVVSEVAIGANGRVTIIASERNVSCDVCTIYYVEFFNWQPA